MDVMYYTVLAATGWPKEDVCVGYTPSGGIAVLAKEPYGSWTTVEVVPPPRIGEAERLSVMVIDILAWPNGSSGAVTVVATSATTAATIPTTATATTTITSITTTGELPTMAEKDADILRLSWDEIDHVLQTTSAQRVLLMGPPGTGKTWAACHPPTRPDGTPRPVFTVTLTDETPAAELRGHFVPHGSEFVWHDGPAIAAWRAAGRLVLNEIDHASPDCMIFMHAVLDDVEFAKLTLPTLEVVRPEPGFSVIATMNAESPDVLNEALADRFAVKIYVDKVHPNALAKLPADLQDAAAVTASVRESDRRVGLRSWMAFAALRAELGDPDLAGRAVFGVRWADLKTALALKGVGTRKKVTV